MSQSHDDIDSNEEEEKKSDNAIAVVDSAPVADPQPMYAHYAFGTHSTRKPYGLYNGIDQLLAERGIFRTTPDYNIPDRDLIFSFIDLVLKETAGPTEDPQITIARVKEQLTAARVALYVEAIKLLQDNVAAGSEPEQYQKYLRKVRAKAAVENLHPLTIVSRDIAEVQSELYDEMKPAFDAVTPYVMRGLLERIDWEWRDELRAEQIKQAKSREELSGGAWEKEEKRQAAIRKAHREGETVEGRTLIRAFMQRERPVPPLQTEPEYLVSPALTVVVDPHWDEKLPPASAEKKKEILQALICMLGKNITPEIKQIQIARVTKTLDGYKVWFMNNVGALGSSDYVNRFAAEEKAEEKTSVIYKNKTGFVVSAIKAVESASAVPHPSYHPLFASIKAADLKTVNRAELIDKGVSTAPIVLASDDRANQQMMLESTERVAALADADIDDSAKLEMNMDVLTDPDIQSAREDEVARLEKVKMQMHILGEKFQGLMKGTESEVHPTVMRHPNNEKSEVDVRARVMLNPENAKLVGNAIALKVKIINKLKAQLAEVELQQKVFEARTQEMAKAFNEKMMTDNNIAAVQSLLIPLHLTMSEFFSEGSMAVAPVFFKLCEDFFVGGEKEEMANPDLLSRYIKQNFNVDQLLEKINHILSTYPKQKNKETSAFVDALKKSLSSQLSGFPAFTMSKQAGGKLVYNPEKLAEEIRHDHSSRIESQKKLLLDKMSHVGLVKDEFDEYRSCVDALAHRFEKEGDELARVKKTRLIMEAYVATLNEKLMRIVYESNHLVQEYAASIAIFASHLVGDAKANKMIADAQAALQAAMVMVDEKEKRMLNIMKALTKLDSRVEDLDEFERRFNMNKDDIPERLKAVEKVMENLIGMTMPLISQKIVLDNVYKELYARLKFILLDHPDSLSNAKKRGVHLGDEMIVIDEMPHRVPGRSASMIKAMQKIAQEEKDISSPEAKLKEVLLAYEPAASRSSPRGLFGALAGVKRGLADMTSSPMAVEFFGIVDALRELESAPEFHDHHELQKISDRLGDFSKKINTVTAVAAENATNKPVVQRRGNKEDKYEPGSDVVSHSKRKPK
jgi:hypothetical protein